MYDIDLDLEFRNLIKENGWWVVLRAFDLGKRSQYWNNDSKEAIGGPAWEYNDIIFKGRRKEGIAGDVETYETRQVLTDVYQVTFYIASRIRPKKEDQIIEIPMDLRFAPKVPREVRAIEVFDIKHVEAKIEKGLIYSRCYCTKLTPSNDITLQGPLPVRHVDI